MMIKAGAAHSGQYNHPSDW